MSNTKRAIRNIAIIAHVDHGKTTLVDMLLRQSGTFRENQQVETRVMDSNDLEKERGITILSKNCAVEYEGTHINIVDTPGHADFGGEVERVLSMVDSVLLLVDAQEGPMPQTRFVTRKALALGLKPIVVVNKVDRPGARAEWAINQTFELFDKLGATDEQLDFPIVYASGLNGYAGLTEDVREGDMKPLFEAILQHVPVRDDNPDGPLQMQVTSLDYSSYVGKIGIGRISRGRIKAGQDVIVLTGPGSTPIKGRINQVLNFKGLERVLVDEAVAGDIVLINGIEEIGIGSTICAPDTPDALEMLTVDEPTLTMNFMVNNSPLAGREGKFVTSRQLRERLDRELKANVALRVAPTDDDTIFEVSGRGELHLSILLETMRREGYEVQVGSPQVIIREIDGEKHEPVEHLVVDVPEQHASTVIGVLASRKGQMVNMEPQGTRTRIEFKIPSRALFGFRTQFLSMTQGEGIMSHIFDGYAPWAGEIKVRQNGSLVSMEDGTAFAYSIWKLQDRGGFFIDAGAEVYVGMIVGENARDQDMNVNVCKNKKLTNVRSSGADDALTLIPPKRMSLEDALEYISDDELVELTPKNIRLRKKILNPSMRK